MTKDDFERKVLKLNIPENIFSLYLEFPSEAYVVTKTSLGWEFYYCERGLKVSQIVFGSDEYAYDHLYDVLRKEKLKGYF